VRALDGVRGVAILLVIGAHYVSPVVSGGNIVGVQLFFVLSGFLITSLLLVEQARTQTISLRLFYVRRALRLLPAFYAMVLLYLLLVAVLGDKLQEDPGTAAASVGLASVYVFNFASAFGVKPALELGPLWTLSVEEQFYLVWPALLMALLARRTSARALVTGLVVAIGLLWIARPITWELLGLRIYEYTHTWADSLLAGVLLAVLVHHGWTARSRLFAVLATGRAQLAAWAVVGVAALLGLKTSALTYAVGLPILACAMATIVWGSASAPQGAAARLLGHRLLVWVGVLSYSLYLYNLLIRYALEAVIGDRPVLLLLVGVPLTFACAAASRVFVEEPALRLKDRVANRVPHREPALGEA
jgi:peptidoglycan/LPS O-acetylase OafA/YrhL